MLKLFLSLFRPLFQSEIDELVSEHNEWETVYKTLTEKQHHTIISQEAELQKLKKKLTPLKVEDAAGWNERWIQNDIYYVAPKKKLLSEYLKEDKKFIELKAIAASFIDDWAENVSIDEIPLIAMKWLDAQSFTYKLDDNNKDVWLTPKEFWEGRVGDCDDNGLLLYSLLREAFKQLKVWGAVKHRLKCVCGNTNRIVGLPSPTGSHFYLLWLHSDGEWKTVETTNNLRSAISFWHKPHKLKTEYGVIWFSWNEEIMWAQNSLVIDKIDYEKY